MRGIGIGLFRRISLGGVNSSVSIVPEDVNTFYLVTSFGGVARSVRFNRNTGGSGGTDLGSKWPEWRVTGEGLLANASSAPSTPLVWIANDIGAQDLVGSKGSAFWGSYHGLGAGGSLNSETVKVDGVTIDPTAGPISGATFELRNSTTATDGVDTLTRDLSVSINASGGLNFTINSISVSAGISYIYAGMGIATGTSYTEMDVKLGTAWNSIPLGSSDADCRMDGTAGIRLRNPSTGHYTALSGNLKVIAGYSRSEVRKETANTRSKGYLARFTSYGVLAGATWNTDWGLGASGSVSPGANTLANTDFTTGWTATSGAAGVSVSAGVAILTQQAAGTAVRYHRPQDGCVSGNWYADSIDVAGTSPNILGLVGGSNTNGSTSTPAPAFSKSTTGAGRQIQVFQATQSDPNQRFLFDIAGAGAGGASCTVTAPATYALAG